MKLLDIQSYQVVTFHDSRLPSYAILSRPFSKDAFRSTHITDDNPLAESIEQAGKLALERDIKFLWIEPLCINASSSAELEHTVNSCLQRLRRSSVCLVYLEDLLENVPSFDECNWGACRYWKHAWTLPELILAPNVEFFDRAWNPRGSKTSTQLLPLVSKLTKIPQSLLLDWTTLPEFSLATRFSWAIDLFAEREEDTIYCLVPITGVTTRVCYGSGSTRVFLNLQEEILRDTCDGSILAWRSANNQEVRGLLARSPSEFCHFATTPQTAAQGPWMFSGSIKFSSKGAELKSRVSDRDSGILLDIGQPTHSNPSGHHFGIYLEEKNGIYVRASPACDLDIFEAGLCQKVAVSRDAGHVVLNGIDTALASSPPHIDTTTEGNIDCHLNFATDPVQQSTASFLSMALKQGHERTIPAFVPVDNGVGDGGVGLQGMGPLAHSPWGNNATESFGISFLGSGWLAQSYLSLMRYLQNLKNIQSNSTSLAREEDLDDLQDEWQFKDDSMSDYTLDPGHEFYAVRPELFQAAHDQFLKWKKRVHYKMCEHSEPLARQRSREYFQEEDTNDSELVIVSHQKPYHMACPFYRNNPAKHQKCLLQYGFRCTSDIICHLRRDHTEPPYCPVCLQPFTAAMERDKHVEERSCEPRESGDIDGINSSQKAMLTKREDQDLDETTMWLKIWVIVFPNSKYICSPYLEDGRELALSMVRDYWAEHGRALVSKELLQRELLEWKQRDEERALVAIYRLVLQDLITQEWEGNPPVESRGFSPPDKISVDEQS